MKKILLFILLIFLLLTCGCASKKEEQIVKPDYAYFPTAKESFNNASQVYEGELICFYTSEELGERGKNNENVKVCVKVEVVYKGTYNIGDTVEDWVFCIDKDFLKEKRVFLFMSGGALHTNVQNVYTIVPLRESNQKREELCYEYLEKYPYSADNVENAHQLRYEMLNIEFIMEGYSRRFSKLFRGVDYALDDLGHFYLLADNVYLGEIVELDTNFKENADIIVEGYDSWGQCDIAKAKIRVLEIDKGEYKQGDIITDILPISQGYIKYAIKNNLPLLCFSGDDFFEGYYELLPIVDEQ